jgi:hypothetical protein
VVFNSTNTAPINIDCIHNYQFKSLPKADINCSVINRNLQIKNLIGNEKIFLYNLQGSLIWEKNVSNSNFEHNISNLADGVYLVKISTNNNFTTYKVIK